MNERPAAAPSIGLDAAAQGDAPVPAGSTRGPRRSRAGVVAFVAGTADALAVIGRIRALQRPSIGVVLLLAVLGAGLWGGRWLLTPQHASGDTFWYARSALRFAGASEEAATAEAARFIVGQGRGTDPDAWVETARTIDRRYPAIFESRPVYPLVAAAFVPVVGLAGLAVSAFIAGVAFALALGLLTHGVTGSAAAAAVAIVAAYLLPSGGWLGFLYADGWMLASLTAALGCATAYVVGGRRAWLVAFAACVAVLSASKSANGAILVASVVVVALLGVLLDGPARRRLAGLAVVAAALGLAQVVLFAALGAPGLNETLQDYFTGHFSRPDVSDPLIRLIRRDLALLPDIARAFLGEPLLLVVGVLGSVPLVLARTTWAWLWVVAGWGSAALVLLHPVLSELPRLMAPLWVTVAFGLTIGAVAIFRRRGDSGASP